MRSLPVKLNKKQKAYNPITEKELTELALNDGATFVALTRDKASQVTVEFICRCGLQTKKRHRRGMSFLCLNDVLKVRVCPQEYNPEKVRVWFESAGCKQLTEYVNAGVLLDFVCKCGLFGSTRCRPERIPKCRKCAVAQRAKTRTKPIDNNVVRDSYKAKQQLKHWRRKVLQIFNGKCVISGVETNLEAHHLASWVSHPTLRFEPSNGVLLTKALHREFHLKYNAYKGTCTRKQFEEFYFDKTGKIYNQ